MTRQNLLLSLLFAICIFNGISSQTKFVNWPDKNIRNQLRDFTDIYRQLDTSVFFENLQYPLNLADASKEGLSCLKELDPNDPLIIQAATSEGMKKMEKELNFETRLMVGFVGIVRQRVVFEKYRFAHLNLSTFNSTVNKLQTSFDSIQWYLYKNNDHPRTKIQINKVEEQWLKKKCCNYFKWYGDFLTLHNIFNDLEFITINFKLLSEIEFDVRDLDLEENHIIKYLYDNPASYYLIDNKNTNVSFLDMVTDVNNCRNELQKLSGALKGSIADTVSMAKTYNQNKERWIFSIKHLQDSLSTSKTTMQDSIRLLRRQHSLYKRQADSIDVVLNVKRKEKDSFTILIKDLTEQITKKTSEELLLNNLRRQYVEERDKIYTKCGDPNCRDSTIIAELKGANEKVEQTNNKLDVIGKEIDDLQKRKRNLTTSLSECNNLLRQSRQFNSEVSQKLSQATSAYELNEKVFTPIIKQYESYLELLEEISEMSKSFFALKYDKKK